MLSLGKNLLRRGGDLMRFYTTPHQFSCGIDRHARPMDLCAQATLCRERRGLVTKPSGPASSNTVWLTTSHPSNLVERAADPRDGPHQGHGSGTPQSAAVLQPRFPQATTGGASQVPCVDPWAAGTCPTVARCTRRERAGGAWPLGSGVAPVLMVGGVYVSWVFSQKAMVTADDILLAECPEF